MNDGPRPERRDNRRRDRRHELAVHYNLGLLVKCSCGMTVGGRRYEDRMVITLSDLLELVRLHSSQLDHPAGKGIRP